MQSKPFAGMVPSRGFIWRYVASCVVTPGAVVGMTPFLSLPSLAMTKLAPYLDLHTHHVRSLPETIQLRSCRLSEVSSLPMHPSLYYSIGLHPWFAEELHEDSLPRLREALGASHVLALGEAGLDKAMQHTAFSDQIRLLRAQIQLSEELGLPLILHLVRAQDELLRLRKELHPDQPWLIHGFRGGIDQARQLLRAGLYLSFGKYFRPESLAAAHAEGRAFLETDDDATLSIQSVYQAASEVLHTAEGELRYQLYARACSLFASLPLLGE